MVENQSETQLVLNKDYQVYQVVKRMLIVKIENSIMEKAIMQIMQID